MVATSPVRHEPPASLQLAPIEVHQCQQVAPWKVLSDFALQADLDQPPFHQLVSSFGESSGEDDDDSTVVCVDEPRAHLQRRSAAGGQRSAVPFQSPLPPPAPQTQQTLVGATAQFSLNAHC